ncbi:MAG: D-alanine--D-alanine ligase, partial [Thermodesulfobacteriota bacterium]
AFTLDMEAVSRRLSDLSPDLVFNIVESVNGRGSLIHLAPALLESLGLRFTGAGSAAMFATSNKIVAKSVLASAGIPTPAWLTVSGFRAGDSAPRGRVIVKAVWEHASIGLSDKSILTVSGPGELGQEIALRQREGGREMFAEEFVEGREFNLSVLSDGTGTRVLPCAEIDFSAFPEGMPRIVDYAAKWEEGAFSYHNTPRSFSFRDSDAGLLQSLEVLALRCFSLFGLSGYARVDFRVDRQGNPFVLEVNANPCIAPDAGFPAAAAQAGLTMDGLVAAIAADAHH